MKKNVAIIGSGISGLSAAYLLSDKYNVHLYEKNSRLGGHTRTLFVQDNSKKIPIDTGFIVFNEKNYPDLTNFFKLLNVTHQDSDMSFAVSNTNPFLEYSGKSIFALFPNFKNIFSIKFLKMIFEIRKLYKLCNQLELNEKNSKLTLDQFLNSNNFSDYLKNYHILPMISSIWSSNIDDVKSFPLATFINFFKNHSLFSFRNRPQWKYVLGGSNQYIKKIINLKLFKYYTNSEISKISRDNNSIKIFNKNNTSYSYDILVFATHADQILNLLDKPSANESKIISNFKYSSNLAYLHCDDTLMPKYKRTWSSWNFLSNINRKTFTLTYWMNVLQNLPTNKNYFVTINPNKKPSNIIDQTVFEHPIYSIKSIEAQKKLMSIQGDNNTYYCGSYLGYGFHEDGIQSSVYVSKLLNSNVPWKREKNFYNRLQLYSK